MQKMESVSEYISYLAILPKTYSKQHNVAVATFLEDSLIKNGVYYHVFTMKIYLTKNV